MLSGQPTRRGAAKPQEPPRCGQPPLQAGPRQAGHLVGFFFPCSGKFLGKAVCGVQGGLQTLTFSQLVAFQLSCDLTQYCPGLPPSPTPIPTSTQGPDAAGMEGGRQPALESPGFSAAASRNPATCRQLLNIHIGICRPVYSLQSGRWKSLRSGSKGVKNEKAEPRWFCLYCTEPRWVFDRGSWMAGFVASMSSSLGGLRVMLPTLQRSECCHDNAISR